MEIWVSIFGYEGLYEVSNMGNVRSLDRKLKGNGNTFSIGRLLSINKNHKYCHVELRKDKVAKWYLVHRLVAAAFVDNKCNGELVNHVNRDSTDNRAENLEWVTYSENIIHNYKTGCAKSKIGDFTKGKPAYNAKVVVNKYTGVFYDSAKEAAESICMNAGCLRTYLSGHRKNKTNLIYC